MLLPSISSVFTLFNSMLAHPGLSKSDKDQWKALVDAIPVPHPGKCPSFCHIVLTQLRQRYANAGTRVFSDRHWITTEKYAYDFLDGIINEFVESLASNLAKCAAMKARGEEVKHFRLRYLSKKRSTSESCYTRKRLWGPVQSTSSFWNQVNIREFLGVTPPGAQNTPVQLLRPPLPQPVDADGDPMLSRSMKSVKKPPKHSRMERSLLPRLRPDGTIEDRRLQLPFLCDTRIMRTKTGKFYIVVSGPLVRPGESQAQDTAKKVVSIDRGVRDFITTYDPSGLVTAWGASKSHSTNGGRDTKNRMRRAALRILERIRCLVNDLHRKAAKWLCSTCNVIYIPKLNFHQLAAHCSGRVVNEKMAMLAHCRFVDTLVHKSREYADCRQHGQMSQGYLSHPDDGITLRGYHRQAPDGGIAQDADPPFQTK
ncbi:uncharacterized protein BJ171DRAFT_629260 [Polychytrium aggregatum]|uniref:uncharacterized protein n=1 Tax=Polychytrium aggregatum TaxID=110093 RepID=UPI0022FEC514|nr:uncharacterized protein BJ171DRAFT_629260 [Polychytrium aggregatum]KAI9201914.1 hypothetical protein BJ171DRAFT_629260 [Polychytrium aggregatum]